tara:strand:- start:5766 stop:7991 length:2226 start_codon:yes stop_codon:yes gene_type:complete
MKKKGKEHHVHHKLSPMANTLVYIVLIVVAVLGVQYLAEPATVGEITDISLVGQAIGKSSIVMQATFCDEKKVDNTFASGDKYRIGFVQLKPHSRLPNKFKKKATKVPASNIHRKYDSTLQNYCQDKKNLRMFTCNFNQKNKKLRLMTKIEHCPKGCVENKGGSGKCKRPDLEKRGKDAEDEDTKVIAKGSCRKNDAISRSKKGTTTFWSTEKIDDKLEKRGLKFERKQAGERPEFKFKYIIDDRCNKKENIEVYCIGSTTLAFQKLPCLTKCNKNNKACEIGFKETYKEDFKKCKNFDDYDKFINACREDAKSNFCTKKLKEHYLTIRQSHICKEDVKPVKCDDMSKSEFNKIKSKCVSKNEKCLETLKEHYFIDEDHKLICKGTFCPDIHDPVCFGEKKFQSKCHANYFPDKFKVCKNPADCGCERIGCENNLKPVCTGKKTYKNKCKAIKDGEVVECDGYCPCNQKKDPKKKPEPRGEALIAHYAFENNGNDKSNNLLHAKSVEGEYVEGYKGNAISFDEKGEEVVLGVNHKLNPQEGISIAAWINLNNWDSINPIVSRIDKDNDQRSYVLNVGYNGKVIFKVFGKNIFHEKIPPRTETHSDFFAITRTKWQHVVATYDHEEGAKIYVNGNKHHKSSAVGLIKKSQTNTVIGGNWNDETSYFDGSIDEVKIFDRALTPLEVEKLFNANKENPCSTELAEVCATKLTEGLPTTKTYTNECKALEDEATIDCYYDCPCIA